MTINLRVEKCSGQSLYSFNTTEYVYQSQCHADIWESKLTRYSCQLHYYTYHSTECWSSPASSHMHTFLLKVKRSKNKILLVGWHYNAFCQISIDHCYQCHRIEWLRCVQDFYKSPFSPTILIKVFIVWLWACGLQVSKNSHAGAQSEQQWPQQPWSPHFFVHKNFVRFEASPTMRFQFSEFKMHSNNLMAKLCN